jgi:AraC-like DNA-binding protein
MNVVNTAAVVFTTLRILGAVLYLALAIAFQAGRVFSRPLRWFLLVQGLAVLTFSSDPMQAEVVRSAYPWIYILFLLPVLSLFPLLYLAARAEWRTAGPARHAGTMQLMSRSIERALILAGSLAVGALIAGALVPGAADWLFPGPGAPVATALLWNVWHLCYLVAAFLLTLSPGNTTRKREEGLEIRLLRLLVRYAIVVFAVSGTLELLAPRLDLPVVSLLLVLLPYGFLALLLARAPALLRLARGRYAGSDLDAVSAAGLADKARTLLQNEHLWADPGLSLQVLAERCASSPRDLSQAINQTFGIGVPAWINGYRLAEAQILLAESDLRVADVAFEVGFNSLSSFNAAFKEQTGLTPTAWRKKLTDS